MAGNGQAVDTTASATAVGPRLARGSICSGPGKLFELILAVLDTASPDRRFRADGVIGRPFERADF
jgi:hypothetical protein